MDPLSLLLQAIDLTPVSENEDNDVFISTAPSHPIPGGRVFGGQLIGQSVAAATRTVPDDRLIHSLHGYFIRAGDATKDVRLVVDRLSDGRSFSTRRVQLVQDDQPRMSIIASFQVESDGEEYQVEIPSDLPGPESGLFPEPPANDRRAFDIRYLDEPVELTIGETGERVAQHVAWVKANGALPDSPALHRTVLAFASDYTAMDPVFRRYGVSWNTPNTRTASLDHALWYHRPARVDEWLLFAGYPVSVQSSRSFAVGRYYRQDGTLVASVTQEAMMRLSARR